MSTWPPGPELELFLAEIDDLERFGVVEKHPVQTPNSLLWFRLPGDCVEPILK